MEKKKNTPKLRFPEFTGEWEEKKLGEIFRISAGGDIDSKHVSKERTEKFNYPIYANTERDKGLYGYSDVYKIESGVVTVTGRGVNIGIAHARNHKFYPIVRLLVLEPLKEENIYFYEYQINRLNLYKESTGVPQLTAPQISIYCVCFPQLIEQTKIATFLTAVDEKLTQLKKKKTLLEQYKKGVMQKLFSQELRFKDDNNQDFPDWEEKTLEEILVEHKTRNKNKDIKEVFSVAKIEGVVNQIDHLGRSYASSDTSNYKVVFPYDLIYTKSPTSDFPYGIIKQNKLKRTGIVSVLYGVFTPKSENIGLLLDYYFSNWKNTYNYLNPLVQKGAKNTMNINNEVFLNGSNIPLPASEVEQEKIATFLSTIDEKIDHCEKHIEQMEAWKKGLLQQMFC